MCSFRRQTGHPCLGCGGTEAFGAGLARPVGRAPRAANPLGAFAGLAAWSLAAASLLTLTGAGAGWLRADGCGSFSCCCRWRFVVNAVVWWLSLPPGALR